MPRLLSTFFQIMKLASPGSVFICIYLGHASEHPDSTSCVCFAFSNLFRADLRQGCSVTGVCWLSLQAMCCPVSIQSLTLSPSPDLCFHSPWSGNYRSIDLRPMLEGVLWPHKRGAGGAASLALLPGEEEPCFSSLWGSGEKAPCLSFSAWDNVHFCGVPLFFLGSQQAVLLSLQFQIKRSIVSWHSIKRGEFLQSLDAILLPPQPYTIT